MYIKRVVLDDLRGFKHLDFDFERPDRRYPGWTVVTGDNAAGKTAFLKAIALALVGTDTARTLQPSLQGWIRRGVSEAVIAVEIVAGEKDKFARDGATSIHSGRS
jgi:recombinational DNA repair ATPase RecF